MVRYGTLRYIMVLYGTVQYGTVLYGAILCVKFSAIWNGECGDIWINTVRYGAVTTVTVLFVL